MMMPRFCKSFSFLLLVGVLSSCTTTPRGDVDPMALVAGDWAFSHVGKPTLEHERVEGMVAKAQSAMDGSTVTIELDGSGNVYRQGILVDFTLEAGESDGRTIPYIVDGGDTTMTYDKRKKLFSYGMKLSADGQTGELPIYYKKVKAKKTAP